MGRRPVRAGGLLALALLASPAAAWTPQLDECLWRDARRLIPQTLKVLLTQREAQVMQELQRFPPELSQAVARDLQAGALRPETLAALDAYAAEAVRLLKQQQISEGVIRLGGLLRIPADLADPALTGASSGFAPGVTREYYAFVEASLSKLPVTLDDAAALELPRRELPRYWAGLAERSRPQAELLRTQLFRQGRLVDHRTLDYRNPVFAVAQISYSRAVTAIAATWSALWREARGDATRKPHPRDVRPQDHGPVEPTGLPPSETRDAGMERPPRAARMER